MLLVLPAFAWVLIGAGFLFALGLVVRMTFDLVRNVKGLAAGLKRANGRLQSAVGEIRAETQLTTERIERIGHRKPRSRRRNP